MIRNRFMVAFAAASVMLAACGSDTNSSSSATPSGNAEAMTPPESGSPEPEGGETEFDEIYSFALSWGSTVGTVGQIVEVMKRTDVLEQWGLEGEFVPFPTAGPAAAAAAAGEIDVYWFADIGLWGIASQGFEWTAVAANNGWRFAIVVPTDSDIENVADLTGKRFGYPFNTGTGKYMEDAIEAEGLEIGSDVEAVNIPFGDIGTALRSGAVDAVGIWDPGLSAQLPDGKIILEGYTGAGTDLPGLTFGVPDEDITSRPEKVIRFLGAFIESQWYASQHQDQVNEWFIDAGAAFPMELLEQTIEYDPLWQHDSIESIDMTITPEQVEVMQASVQYFVDKGVLEDVIDPADYIDTELVAEAQRRVADRGAPELTVRD